jgi:hypothetical protein
MVTSLRRVVLIAAAALAVAGARAQEVSATSRLDSSSILIGDWLALHIEVDHPSTVTITMPALPDTFGGIDVVRRDKPAVATANGDRVKESATFIITAFDSGMHIVPPLEVFYTLPGDTSRHSARTAPAVFNVVGIAVDTSAEIKDIKPPLGVSLTLADLLPYIIALLLIGGITWLVIYIRRRRRMGVPLIPEAPPQPAHEVALEALRALESEKVWQRGLLKDFYSQLTDILRVYLERRFGILAMEMTSEEILSSAAISSLSRDVRDPLRTLLTSADLVKFAKHRPADAENAAGVPAARSIVEMTSATAVPADPAPAGTAPKTEVAA